MRALILVLGVALIAVAGWRLWVTGSRTKPSGRWYLVLVTCAFAVAVVELW